MAYSSYSALAGFVNLLNSMKVRHVVNGRDIKTECLNSEIATRVHAKLRKAARTSVDDIRLIKEQDSIRVTVRVGGPSSDFIV